MKNPIDTSKAKVYYIINKDIVSRHINTELYRKIKSFNLNHYKNNNFEQNIDNLIEEFKKNVNIGNEKIIENKGIKETFLNPEKLKLKCYEYYNNFFILQEDIFDLFKNYNYNTKGKTFIGREGIFIERFFKDSEGNSKLSIYFIKCMDKVKLDNFRLNKVYIFNNEKQFLNEFDNNMKGKKAESYFAVRNFVNKGGIFNITDNGKKIGLYININRKENYIDDESEIDENREYIKKFLD